MAIVRMKKVMLAVHRSQVEQMLSALQEAGIMQVLDAERAMVSKEWPELEVEVRRPKEIEELVGRLGRATGFLKAFSCKKGFSLFEAPAGITEKSYSQVVLGDEALAMLGNVDGLMGRQEKLFSSAAALENQIQRLRPWRGLSGSLEELNELSSASCLAGLIPVQHFQQACDELVEVGAAVETAGADQARAACIVVCLPENLAQVQKILRSMEFEAVSFEGLKGTAAQNLQQRQNELDETKRQLAGSIRTEATELAGQKLKLEILYDHYSNLLNRQQVQANAPATGHAVFLEGWVKAEDYAVLAEIAGRFDGADLAEIPVAQDEEVPVEIKNAAAVRPFESVTRLYGMPLPSSVDPTVFLAPFFAIFFGLCVADVGYGLIMVAILAWALKKTHGDKKILWMLLICGITTFLAGAVTGSWFGDAITALLPENTAIRSALNGAREKIMLFDPMTQPMRFFLLSLGLGYFQIQCGLFIAFLSNLFKKDIAAAVCDQLIWIIHLNSLLCLGLAKSGYLPAFLAKPCGIIAILTSLNILLFTVRSGGWGGRLGLGFYQLFSTVFYMGDVLSYARLMALGMVGAGFGMAVNVMVKLFAQVPYVGWLLAGVCFVGGHLFNIALSMLGAFVHTMRLQFVEFFPKFFVGGGHDFIPLQKEYRHIRIKN